MLPTPLPIQLRLGGLSLVTVQVSVKLSPAVGWSVDASILTSLVKNAAKNEKSLVSISYRMAET